MTYVRAFQRRPRVPEPSIFFLLRKGHAIRRPRARTDPPTGVASRNLRPKARLILDVKRRARARLPLLGIFSSHLAATVSIRCGYDNRLRQRTKCP